MSWNLESWSAQTALWGFS